MLLISLTLGLLVGLFIIFYLWQVGPASFFTLLKTDLNLNSPEYSNANVIIQDPKKVYVSQDLKINESNNYLNEAVVGVFPKSKALSDARYIMDENLMSGLIISSDGWILVNVLHKENFDKAIISNPASYVVISKKNKKLHEIDKVVYDSSSSILFIKMKSSSNLPVRNFINVSELSVGQTLLAYNFSGDVMINSIKSFDSGKLVKSTESFTNLIELNTPLSPNFKNSYIFDLNGDLIALIDADLKVRPIHDFRSGIFNFLSNKEVVKFKYGLSYINLSDIYQENLPNSGALIYNNGALAVQKGSLGEVAGILEGDVIVKINSYEIKGDLNDVLNNFSAGDKLNISVWRKGDIKDFRLELK